ncbi:MAG: DUF805 domain-containing protein [Xanthobacteraceae bacterium]|jgi:uncharacterized membrane protein YhaH (DUF805 family)
MRWIRFFSNLDGRIGRKTFWLMSLAVVAIEFVVILISVALTVALSIADWWIEVVIIAFIYPKFVIDVKRGHDRNIPFWVIATFYVVVIVRLALIQFGWLQRYPSQNLFSSMDIVSFAVTLLLGIVSLALLVELGFRKGRPGANPYGPDPLATA